MHGANVSVTEAPADVVADQTTTTATHYTAAPTEATAQAGAVWSSGGGAVRVAVNEEDELQEDDGSGSGSGSEGPRTTTAATTTSTTLSPTDTLMQCMASR